MLFQKNFVLCLSNVIEAAEAATKRKIMKILGLKLSQTAIFKIFPVSTHKSKNISTDQKFRGKCEVCAKIF